MRHSDRNSDVETTQLPAVIPYVPPAVVVCGTVEDLTGALVRGGDDGALAGTQNAG